MMKLIPNIPNYIVNENGEVFNATTGRRLAPQLASGGRVRVNLQVDKKQKMFAISRLVAITFIPNPDNLPQVDHIDGNRTNNHVSNLRWCTQEQNCSYRAEQGNNGNPSLQYVKLSYNDRKYCSISELSRELSKMRGCKTETVRKEIQRCLRTDNNILYGKKLERSK